MDQLTLSDGRQLDYRVSGPDDGIPLLFFHGTPGAGTLRRWLEEPAHARGMRVVSWSRPGYGHSSRHAGRSVADVVDDAAQVMAALDVDTCFVAGASGGGPHSLACAAGLEGVRSALVIASVAPFRAPGLDFLAGMGQDNIDEFAAALQGEDALRSYLDAESVGMSDTTIEGLMSAIASLFPEADVAVLTDDVAASLVASTHESVRSGVDGWLDDDLAFTSDWGFGLDEISVPISLWQGSEDLMVPLAHGRWLADHLPTASAHFELGEGHISVSVGAIEAMYDELLELA